MFIHAVLFEIKPSQVCDYRDDSKMWAREARKASGFIAYFTMQREGYKNQYISVYEWKTERAHRRFMSKFHDLLVSKSKAKVKVLSYYNLKEIDRVR
jgi:quinol monooxygenase YgiN